MACMSLSHRLDERKLCVLKCTFGFDRLQLTLPSLLLENLRRS